MYLYTWLLDSITPTILVLIRPALLGCLISLTFSMMMRLGMRMIMRMTLIRCHIRTVPPCPPCCPPSSGASLPGVARCWHRQQGESRQGGGGEIGWSPSRLFGSELTKLRCERSRSPENILCEGGIKKNLLNWHQAVITEHMCKKYTG